MTELIEETGSCPCCGAVGGETLARSPALLAVCDVLVVRALETVGKRIVRSDRSRFGQMQGRPWHVAHTLWRPEERDTAKVLDTAWDVVPAMLQNHGCCGLTANQIVRTMDDYVRDLLVTGTAHNLSDLRYRFEKFLGLPIPLPTEAYHG